MEKERGEGRGEGRGGEKKEEEGRGWNSYLCCGWGWKETQRKISQAC
jgi:hypothetical protein